MIPADESVAAALEDLASKVGQLTQVLLDVAARSGARITREELATRLGVHRSTLLRRLQTDRNFPRPGPDGKWLLSEVVKWELSTQMPPQHKKAA